MRHSGVFFSAFYFSIALLFVCAGFSDSFAAQSSEDVPADTAFKDKIRKEILGQVDVLGGEKDYIVGFGDILQISVYGEGDMAASASGGGRDDGEAAGDALRRPGTGVEVRLDGNISLQHVGDVKVVGMTLTQLADYLKKIYATVYSDPVVTAVLVQSNSRRYTVMGQVNEPGIFYLDYPLTIVQAIARSGGFTEWANHDVTVVRQGDGLPSDAETNNITMQFDYDMFLKGKEFEKNLYIRSGDVIVIH